MLPQQLQQWFAKLTSNSPFFFAVIDNQHNYCMVNERYCDIAGLSQAEMVGMNDSQTLGEQFYKHIKPYYERAFNGESIEAEITLNETDLETSIHFSLSPVEKDKRPEYVIFHA